MCHFFLLTVGLSSPPSRACARGAVSCGLMEDRLMELTGGRSDSFDPEVGWGSSSSKSAKVGTGEGFMQVSFCVKRKLLFTCRCVHRGQPRLACKLHSVCERPFHSPNARLLLAISQEYFADIEGVKSGMATIKHNLRTMVQVRTSNPAMSIA